VDQPDPTDQSDQADQPDQQNQPDPSESPADQRAPKKKKRKKKHFFLNIVIVILVLVGLYFLATSNIFAIKDITVISSGHHFTASQTAELSGIKEGDNLWKTRTGRAEDKLMKDPYISKAEIRREPPGTIVIDIKERVENYLIRSGQKYAVLDWSGIVLNTVDQAPNLPIIEGVEIADVVTGSAVKAKRGLLLADVVKLLQDTEKTGLYFKRVVVEDVDCKAYIYDTLSVKGKLENIESSLDNIKIVMLDLKKQKIKRGTILVGSTGNCTYSPEEQ